MPTQRIRIRVLSHSAHNTPFQNIYGPFIARVAPDPSSGLSGTVRTLVVDRTLWNAEIAAGFGDCLPYLADVADGDPVDVLDGN
jgi:hypothetical protein